MTVRETNGLISVLREIEDNATHKATLAMMEYEEIMEKRIPGAIEKGRAISLEHPGGAVIHRATFERIASELCNNVRKLEENIENGETEFIPIFCTDKKDQERVCIKYVPAKGIDKSVLLGACVDCDIVIGQYISHIGKAKEISDFIQELYDLQVKGWGNVTFDYRY